MLAQAFVMGISFNSRTDAAQDSTLGSTAERRAPHPAQISLPDSTGFRRTRRFVGSAESKKVSHQIPALYGAETLGEGRHG